MVIPYEANALETIVETIVFATDILTAMDGAEQRRKLRWHPTGKIEFSVLVSGEKAAKLMGMIHANQGRTWIVPLWHLAERLTVAATAGATEFTTFDDSIAGFWDLAAWHQPFAMLWKDDATYEICHVTELQDYFDNLIQLDDPLAATWPVGTWSIPCRVGRLDPEVAVNWESRETLSARLKFSFDQWGPTAQYETWQIGAYGLYDQPNRRGAVEDLFTRRLVFLDSVAGQRTVDVLDVSPGMARSFVYSTAPRLNAQLLRFGILQNGGRAFGFFVPTWDQDLILASPVTAGSDAVVVKNTGYGTLQFPQNAARRHIRITDGAFSNYEDVHVVSVTTAGDTETLNLLSPCFLNHPVTDRVSFLRYVRFDDDATSIEWSGRDFAEAVIRIREIPLESWDPAAP